MCPTCQDKGLIKVCYHSGEPTDYALCLCPIGLQMRSTKNAGKETGYCLAEVWCAKEQVEPERVTFLEDVVSAAVLQELGFKADKAEVSAEEAALIRIGQTRKGPKL